nr:MAG: ORF1 [Torque teno midi virus]
MPFWWGRRKRWWRGRRRPYYRRKYHTKRRRRRRPFYRRKSKRTYRRRRRRTKVRRKKQTLKITQWQPDTIRKCKIKGFITHVLGAQGKQFACYSDTRFDWVPPRTPGGGGFGVEKYTLAFLYDEYLRGNNIWTFSNVYLELVRYNGCRFKFFRHQTMDFVGCYQRMYPMELEKYTYADSHPYSILKKKHHFIIPSFRHKHFGKPYVIVKIKPPKQTTNKWYFQETFAPAGLVKLTTAVCDLSYSNIGSSSSNQLMTFYAINLQFYVNAGWGNATHTTTYGWYRPASNTKTGTLTGKDINGKTLTANITTNINDYKTTVDYTTGYFTPNLLQMAVIDQQNVLPIVAARYNPTRDDGKGNAIWLQSILNTEYGPPRTDKTLIADNLPIWQLCFGFINYVQKIKKDPTFLKTYYIVVQSNYFEPHHGLNKFYVPVDQTFIQGKGPYGEWPTQDKKQKWYPTLDHQLETLNSFVECGPFIPKLDNKNLSTWELRSKYCFYFKWGGSQLPEQETTNPAEQGIYEIPDKLKQALQVLDPKYNKAKKAVHAWDFRRGILTKKAAKRILEDSESSGTLSTISGTPEKKKKKYQGNALQVQEEETSSLQSCLLSLCEENTFQETQENPDLLQLIKQQQQQQQQIKFNLLSLISKLKKKQTTMQLQTGLLH